MTETEVNYRAMPEYREGRREYSRTGSARMKLPDSPYKNGDKKIAWLVGWLDDRTAERLPGVFG